MKNPATGEYSIEAWIAPANTTKRAGYILSYSAGINTRNFTLGQVLYSYRPPLCTVNANGEPPARTDPDDGDAQATATRGHQLPPSSGEGLCKWSRTLATGTPGSPLSPTGTTPTHWSGQQGYQAAGLDGFIHSWPFHSAGDGAKFKPTTKPGWANAFICCSAPVT